MTIINDEIIKKGTVISPGTVIAPICHFQAGSVEQTAIYKVDEDSINDEIERLNNAIEMSKEELKLLAANVENFIGENEAKIFETHILVLEDKSLLDKIYKKVKNEKINIEFAVKYIFEEFEDIFAKMDDEYLKDRGTDFSEIKRRLLSHLTGDKGRFLCRVNCNSSKNNPRIVLTNELSTSMISLLKDNNIIGFITSQGGLNSHAAILTKALGIPYITGINVIDRVKCGTTAIIDGENNRVIFNSRKETVNKYKNIINNNNKLLEKISNLGPVVITKSGYNIEISGNIIGFEDIKFINKYNLAGIGLVRTEFLFFDNVSFPTLDDQIDVYSDIVKKMKGGKPVTFRLFDIGGDKKLKSLDFINEENPLLGLRGIRFLMKNRKILENQVKAIGEAGKLGKVRILYPMISDYDELLKVNKIVKEYLKEVDAKNIEIGMMFEVPSVFISPEKFIKEIDFASIGSNDLVQYLFGIDRNNAHVSYLYKQDNDIVYELIKSLINAASKCNKEVSICGEIDYSTNFIDKIIKIGINKISVSPISVLKLFERLKSI